MKKKIAVETAWSLVAKALSFVFLFATNIVLTRHLTSEEFGRWSFILSVIVMINIVGGFGIDSVIRTEIASADKTEHPAILKNAFAVKIIVNSAIGTAALGLLYYYFDFDRVTSLLIVFYLLIVGIWNFQKEIFLGLHALRSNLIISVFAFGLKFLAVWLIYLIRKELDIVTILLSYILVDLLGNVLALTILNKEYLFVSLRLSYFEALAILMKAPHFTLASLGFAISSEINTWLLKILSNETQVAYYSVSNITIGYFPQITLAFALGILPLFAKLAPHNILDRKKLLYRYLRINFAATIVIVIVILLFSPEIMTLIYGKNYYPSAMVIRWMTIYLFVSTNSVLISGFLDYSGNIKQRAHNLSFAVLLNIILDVLLIPKFGAVGAAISSGFAYLPYLFLNYKLMKNGMRISKDLGLNP